MTCPDYDLIICGAGPAGATAATIAARAGLSVALVEKYPLPRHKTCGGGTPMVVERWFHDLVPDAFVECRVQSMRHTWQFGDAYCASINAPDAAQPYTLWMVQRSQFDQALVEQAAQAGADIKDGLMVQQLQIESGTWAIAGPGGASATRVRVVATPVQSRARAQGQTPWQATATRVIGADGANGITARAAGLRRDRTLALGMEVELPYDWSHPGHPDLRPEVAHLEYGAIPHGYAWIFPKREHLNVGAGLFHPQKRDVRGDRAVHQQLKTAITQYLDSLNIPYSPEQLRFHAHPLPIWGGPEPLHSPDGHFLLVGDAAGLINPLFGDGILPAIKSGALAAESVIEGKVTEYSDRIHRQLGKDFDAAARLAQFFYQHPSICYRFGVKHPRGTPLAMQMLAGELSFTEMGDRAMARFRRAMGLGWFGGGDRG